MNIRLLKTALLGFITIIILNWSCTKLDTTNLGSDLLPVVDNINTFADTLSVEAYQGLFTDTTTINRNDEFVLGKITTDMAFGNTDAGVYFQLKPSRFPFSIAPTGDTLVGLDSVVLALSFRGSWGDTTIPQQLTVREIPANTGGIWDSLYKRKPLTYAPNTGQLLLYNNAPFQLVDIRNLNKQVKFFNGKDSSIGQIRIRLDTVFARKLYNQDSSAVTRPGFAGNAFFSDSLFRNVFKGLAVESILGEALMTLSLADTKTRLEIHYKKRRNNIIDTAYTSLALITGERGVVLPSAVANKIIRTNQPFLPVSIPRTIKNEIFMQTTPGTAAELYLPRLNTFKDTNRIIHRAQLRITQIPDANILVDKIFTPPAFLYLDLRDSTTAVRHKPVYIDLNPAFIYNPDNVPVNSYFPQEIDFGYYGGFIKKKTDVITGREITYYDFNVTRYIQRMVTTKTFNYELRLLAPYTIGYPQYTQVLQGYPNRLAHGRVKVGGTNGNYKMQMVIIWSKIKVQ